MRVGAYNLRFWLETCLRMLLDDLGSNAQYAFRPGGRAVDLNVPSKLSPVQNATASSLAGLDGA